MFGEAKALTWSGPWIDSKQGMDGPATAPTAYRLALGVGWSALLCCRYLVPTGWQLLPMPLVSLSVVAKNGPCIRPLPAFSTLYWIQPYRLSIASYQQPRANRSQLFRFSDQSLGLKHQDGYARYRKLTIIPQNILLLNRLKPCIIVDLSYIIFYSSTW